MSAESAVRFPCTAGGPIAAGRERIKRLLLGMAAVLVAVAVWAWIGGRVFPGVLCLGLALFVFVIWRMSAELEPLWVEVAPGRLTLRTRFRLLEVGLAPVDEEAVCARRLDAGERRHLAELASIGGLVASAGGFDSHRLGEFDLYGADLENAVLVEAGGRRLVLTPDDPEAFVRALLAATGAPGPP